MIRAKVASTETKFRADINGLRAIAVVSVVLFHFKVKTFPGGFVGVDVFFVVSGYLMTSIILSQLENNRFSLFHFYSSRARRIMPALLCLCTSSLVLGTLWIDPESFRQLAKTVVSSMTFVSNFEFWREAGYFDQRSENKWLLHTWSLSVEGQFYMLYPMLLIALFRLKVQIARIPLILCTLLIISLGLSAALTPILSSGSFYLLPTRGWELLTGAIVATKFNNVAAHIGRPLQIVGLAMILVSVVWFDNTTPWPSYRACLPVLGTAIVIAARQNSPLLSIPPLQFLGSWSYAIYIWHWPVVVGAAYFDAPQGLVFKLVSLAVIIGGGSAAAATLQLLSRKLKVGKMSRISPDGRLLLGSALVITAALGVFLTDGMEFREGARRTQIDEYRNAMSDWDYPSSCRGLDHRHNLLHCDIGTPGSTTTLIIGDSFAEQLYPRAKEIARSHPDQGFEFMTSDGCAPAPGVNEPTAGATCDYFTREVLHYAENAHYEQLLIASIWYTYFIPGSENICFVEGRSCFIENNPARFNAKADKVFDDLKQVIIRIRRRGIKVVMLLPTPFSKYNVPAELLKDTFFDRNNPEHLSIYRSDFERQYGIVRRRLIALAQQADVKLVDPLDDLCHNGTCPTVDVNGRPLYRDSSHFRSTVVASNLFSFLDRALLSQDRASTEQ